MGTAGANSAPNRIGTISGDAAARPAPTSAVTNVDIRAARPTRVVLASPDSNTNITSRTAAVEQQSHTAYGHGDHIYPQLVDACEWRHHHLIKLHYHDPGH